MAEQNLSYPLEPNAPTPESVQLLRRKAAASQTVTSSLLAEAARNDAIIAQLQALTSTKPRNEGTPMSEAQARQLPDFSFLNSSPSSRALNVSTSQPAQQPLTTNTIFTLSQLPAIKAILADLRPKLPTLQSTEHDLNSAMDERRQERRDYIDQRTRSHLGRNSRAHRDNTTTVNGRRIDQEEVDALEKVASIMSRQ